MTILTGPEKKNGLSKEKPKKNGLVKPVKDLSSVPTSIESHLSFDGEGRNANEVLGVLVAAHEREAMSILERTRLKAEDVVTVANSFFIAKHGIGGPSSLDHPIPEVSEWTLNILRALPSIDGKSRKEFVDAWQTSQNERARQRAEEDRHRNQFMGG